MSEEDHLQSRKIPTCASSTLRSSRLRMRLSPTHKSSACSLSTKTSYWFLEKTLATLKFLMLSTNKSWCDFKSPQRCLSLILYQLSKNTNSFWVFKRAFRQSHSNGLINNLSWTSRRLLMIKELYQLSSSTHSCMRMFIWEVSCCISSILTKIS